MSCNVVTKAFLRNIYLSMLTAAKQCKRSSFPDNFLDAFTEVKANYKAAFESKKKGCIFYYIQSPSCLFVVPNIKVIRLFSMFSTWLILSKYCD